MALNTHPDFDHPEPLKREPEPFIPDSEKETYPITSYPNPELVDIDHVNLVCFEYDPDEDNSTRPRGGSNPVP